MTALRACNYMTNKEKIKDFTDLVIYQMAEDIALRIDKLANDPNYPLSKKFKMKEHLIEVAVSIGSNIAEGFGRYHYKEYIRFLYIARGSLDETRRRLRHVKLMKYVDIKEAVHILKDLEVLRTKINNSISSTCNKINE